MNECNPDARGLSGFAAFLAPTAILKSIADAATLRGGNAEKTTTDVLNNFATLRFAVSVGATILRIVFFVASATLGMWLCIYYVQKLSNDKCLGGQLIAQYASGNSSDRGGDAGADAPIGDTANDESSDVVAASGDDEAVVDVATADLLQQSLSSEASAHGATAGQKDLLSILPPLQAQSSPAAAPIAPPSQTVPAAAPSPIAAQSS
ncbi:MAG: hypothetical protein LBI39_00290, partial [Puniceicoccales bacterium]|nr:hypothetical protein [Puniceicoccales bacterium]